MQMRTVVFDLDGTLADTSRDLIAAANRWFCDGGHGEMLDPVKAAGTALRGGRAMLKLGLERLGRVEDDATVEQFYHVFLDVYEAEIDTHTTLYPGAMEAVEALRRDNYAVAICTNKPDHLAELLLSRLGVRDSFSALIGANTLPVRKPDPDHLWETNPQCRFPARQYHAADRPIGASHRRWRRLWLGAGR